MASVEEQGALCFFSRFQENARIREFGEKANYTMEGTKLAEG